MIARVRQSFDKLERQKEAVLCEAGSCSAEQLHFRPEPSSWSTLDVLDHVHKVERAFLGAVQGSFPDGQPVAFKERMMAWVVIGVMRSPMRIKVPPSAGALVMPETPVDLTAVSSSWAKTRGEMAELLDTLQQNQIERGLFRHPVSGWMTIGQAMGFLSAHIRDHEYQLVRLRSATAASGS